MFLIKKAVEEALKEKGLNINYKKLENHPNLIDNHKQKFVMTRKSKVGKIVEKRENEEV
jgi:hypothetical protein|tara:strand:+ start:31 stop:207 length:177 start_codon:yes stop_codon:yes gene_type:complete